jgi:hypothetical protein
MHLGPEKDYNYMMEENMIANTMEEKDLGIIIKSQTPDSFRIRYRTWFIRWRVVCGPELVTVRSLIKSTTIE